MIARPVGVNHPEAATKRASSRSRYRLRRRGLRLTRTGRLFIRWQGSARNPFRSASPKTTPPAEGPPRGHQTHRDGPRSRRQREAGNGSGRRSSRPVAAYLDSGPNFGSAGGDSTPPGAIEVSCGLVPRPTLGSRRGVPPSVPPSVPGGPGRSGSAI